MKCQNLFSRKNKKNISKCHLLKILPRALSADIGWPIVPDSVLFSTKKKVQYRYVTYFSMKTCCGYSLEPPHWGASDEFTQHVSIYGEIRKVFTRYPILFGTMGAEPVIWHTTHKNGPYAICRECRPRSACMNARLQNQWIL